MLRALGIYLVLFTVVAVIFLLDRINAFDGWTFYVWCAVPAFLALLFAFNKTAAAKRNFPKSSEPDKKDRIDA